jgi:lipoate-protein ligase A
MIHFLDLGHTPIFEQLKLEEALLRGTDWNFCIVNRGSPRAIVMGISGKPEVLLDLKKVQKDKIPVIKRFSGGGTVIVDEDTLFITFILSKNAVPIAAFPEPILRWSGDIYEKSWKIPGFHVEENDYAIGPQKCGGNAQYIQKDRWLHHTSFLWDFKNENMVYLTMPLKQPRYRQNRNHLDFLCRLNAFGSKEELIAALQVELIKRFSVKPISINELTWKPHRESVQLVLNS